MITKKLETYGNFYPEEGEFFAVNFADKIIQNIIPTIKDGELVFETENRFSFSTDIGKYPLIFKYLGEYRAIEITSEIEFDVQIPTDYNLYVSCDDEYIHRFKKIKDNPLSIGYFNMYKINDYIKYFYGQIPDLIKYSRVEELKTMNCLAKKAFEEATNSLVSEYEPIAYTENEIINFEKEYQKTFVKKQLNNTNNKNQ